MSKEVKIPALGESITSGVLSAWHVQDGDVVAAGQLLYELETDKITSEGHAEVGGKVEFKVAEGDEVEIGQVVATIDKSVAAGSTSAPATAAPTESASEAKSPAGQPVSPAVNRIAKETGIDPATVAGSGKEGRVTKGDMLAASKPAAPAAPSTPAPKAAPPARDPSERVTRTKMSPMRARIAERLVAAQHEAALLTTFNEVDMSAVMSLRKKYQEEFVKKHNVKLGFMSFFVKAAVKALQDIPEINSQIDGQHVLQNHYYDIGVAVGGPKGLVVPVVRDCDQLGFHEIENEIIQYAKRARDGKIKIEEMQGGVFTISNGGIYGSMLSTPIINPPQSAILGMHAIKERAVVINKEIVIRPMMYLALSYDHRIVDGKGAVTFLNKIKEAIEDPSRLLYQL